MFRGTNNADEPARKSMTLSRLALHARTLRNLCYVREYQAASRMAELRIDPTAVVYERGTRAYWIPELAITLTPSHHVLLAALWQALVLKRAGAHFSNEGNEIIVHTPCFSVEVENEDELFILREVVANGVYNVLPGTPGAVVLDIGMNTGFASLHFAAQPWVAEVWGYEPVPETYERAVRNLKRNPKLAEKIKAHNYGLSDTDGQMTCEYSSAWRGAAGLHGLLPEFRRNHRIAEAEIKQVSVKVQRVGTVLRQLQEAWPEAHVIVKLDCEGSEYPIIASLHSAGLLRQIDAFLIEWHQRGATELVETLSAEDFFVLSLTPQESTGMIYACRRGGRGNTTA